MTDKKIIHKIYRMLDGELDAAELRELENHLLKNPEAARFSKEWKMIRTQLERTKAESLNVDLNQEILNRIDMETYRQQPKNDEIIVRGIWSQPLVKYSFAFVLGVFVGFLIFSIFKVDFNGKEASVTELKGTFLNSQSFDNMRVADVLQYNSPVANANCQVRYSDKIVEIRLDLSSQEPVKATIEFNYGDLQVLNVQNISVNDQSTAMATSNYVQIHNVGDNKYIIQLYNKNKLPHLIDFKIFQNESPVYQNSVEVNKE
jgi:hypothetical protein